MKTCKCLTCEKFFKPKDRRNRPHKFCSWNCVIKRGTAKRDTKYSTFSNEYLLEKLKEASILLGGFVSSRDIDKLDGFPKRGIFERRFGKWGNALKLIHLPIKPTRPPRNPKKPNAPLRLRFRIFKRDNFTCQYCGRTPQDGAKLVTDHINPVANGGLTVFDNLIASCFECNSGKSDFLLE